MYWVPVRNELTGEIHVVEVASNHQVDAQITALQRMFKEQGWRKATALLPEVHVQTPA